MATTTELHLGYGEKPPRVQVHRYPTAPPIVTVDLDGRTLTVTASDPAHLRLVAEAFTDASRQLSDELDKHAARQVNAKLPDGLAIGASCPCGNHAAFTSYEAAEQWEQEHAECADDPVSA